MKIKIFPIFLITFLFFSCYTQQEINTAMADRFTGIHYSEIISAAGCPNQVLDDGSGGRYLQYTYTTSYTMPGYSTTTTNYYSTTSLTGKATIYDNYIWGSANSTSSGTATSNTIYSPAKTYTNTYYLTFHINSSGIVKDISYSLPYATLQEVARQYYKNHPKLETQNNSVTTTTPTKTKTTYVENNSQKKNTSLILTDSTNKTNLVSVKYIVSSDKDIDYIYYNNSKGKQKYSPSSFENKFCTLGCQISKGETITLLATTKEKANITLKIYVNGTQKINKTENSIVVSIATIAE